LTQQLARLSGKSAPHGRSRHSTVPLGWRPRYDIRTSLADYIQRIEKLESLANGIEGVENSYAIQAGREIRVICHHRKVDDAQAALLASDLAKRIQSEMDYPGRIKVTVIREMRAVEYARHNRGNGNEKGMGPESPRRVQNPDALRAARSNH